MRTTGVAAPSVVVLLEGRSDVAAVRAAATALGVDLQRTRLVSMGGITNLPRHLVDAVDTGSEVRGLYDAAEGAYVVRCLRRGGFDATMEATEGCGFFACDRDLEEELVRTAGGALVRKALVAAGLARPFETLTHQPDWRERPFDEQVRRFVGAGSGRKALFARTVVEALGPDRQPVPIAGLLRSLPG